MGLENDLLFINGFHQQLLTFLYNACEVFIKILILQYEDLATLRSVFLKDYCMSSTLSSLYILCTLGDINVLTHKIESCAIHYCMKILETS